MTASIGVLLMSYGSPSSLDDVPAYLARVRNRPVDPELADEFTRRYRVIGGSPLVAITGRQAAALEEHLGRDRARVLPAMRFSEPSIETALRELASLGIERVVGVVLSPQFSPLLMGGYERAIGAARAEIGPTAPAVTVAGAWHTEPAFVAALGARIRDALQLVGDGLNPPQAVPVLLTAHSLPLAVAEREPDYLGQLRETAALVADAAGLAQDQWHFCWQSAGHEPGEWMKPDFADLMPELAAAGHRAVVVAPVQFLADHLEILYDVDIGAREQAEAAGLRFTRIRSLNDDPRLIEAFASIVEAVLSRETAVA
jgi:protoporphyrin/coproporphyrin ferrochelatase